MVLSADPTPEPAPLRDPEEFIVGAEDVGERLDRFLVARVGGISRVRVQEAIRSGSALWNGCKGRPSEPLRGGDTVSWLAPAAPAPPKAEPEAIPLQILWEDEHLIVVNKPAGMVVHPGAGHATGTFVSALLHHCGWSGGSDLRPGIVHRLDKETSGCLAAAKSETVQAALAAQFAGREVEKTYLALVAGIPRRSFGRIDMPIARHPVQRKKMAVTESGRGREAVTAYRVLGSEEGRSLLECKPETGRTHQIRVHLKHLGHPVLGDPLYGRRADFTRHMLHAWKLVFRHPITGEAITTESPPPDEFGFRSFQEKGYSSRK